MADYSERHYGNPSWRLSRPMQIVEHVAVTSDLESIYNTFASDQPDPELGELPNVCSHYAVSERGEIWQLVPVSIRCRHTVGLNYATIGIEHVGYEDGDVLENPLEMKASLRLTQALRCKFGIGVRDVIGHNESLESRFHKENVESLRSQTHGDFAQASMDQYRSRLRRLGPCLVPDRETRSIDP